jgi:hypothetical protein
MGKLRKHVRRAGLGTAALGLSVLMASCISNPGPFTVTALTGSQLTLSSGGSTTQVFRVGTPACADGVDNDLDGSTDGVDAQCDSTSDANERINGVQAFVAPTIPVDINAAGQISFDPTELSFQAQEVCIATTACVAATVKGTGSEGSGTIDPETGAMSMSFTAQIDLDNAVGFGTLPADCHVGPAVTSLVATDYSETDGKSTLVKDDVAVAAVTSCGDLNSGINSVLGLPGELDVVLNSQTLNASNDPPRFDD